MDNTRICPMCGVEPIDENFLDDELCGSCGDMLEDDYPELRELNFMEDRFNRASVVTEVDDGFDKDGNIEDGGSTGC